MIAVHISAPAVGLHHHRFLERRIARVLITTLWQIDYTAKKCPPFGQTKPDEPTKREQYFHALSAPASAGGRAVRVWGPGADPSYRARGGTT
jgi:hypothetical protein